MLSDGESSDGVVWLQRVFATRFRPGGAMAAMAAWLGWRYVRLGESGWMLFAGGVLGVDLKAEAR
jgi:hypothetical protein